MIRLDDTLIVTPQITPTQARMVIIASWKAIDPMPPPVPPLCIEGKVIGPRCEYAETLLTQLPFRSTLMLQSLNLKATVQILEPCFWEPAHPFCYDVQLELYTEDRLLDMRRIISGIRHLEVDGLEFLLNGQPFFLEGVKNFAGSSVMELAAWHDAGCGAFLMGTATGLCERTDRWGPMLLHLVPPVEADVRSHVTRLRNHPSLLMWVLPSDVSGEHRNGLANTIRELDRSRLIGRLIPPNEPVNSSGPEDVRFLPLGHLEIGDAVPNKPIIVVGRAPADSVGCTPDTFAERLADLRDSLGSLPGLVGVIL